MPITTMPLNEIIERKNALDAELTAIIKEKIAAFTKETGIGISDVRFLLHYTNGRGEPVGVDFQSTITI